MNCAPVPRARWPAPAEAQTNGSSTNTQARLLSAALLIRACRGADQLCHGASDPMARACRGADQRFLDKNLFRKIELLSGQNQVKTYF